MTQTETPTRISPLVGVSSFHKLFRRPIMAKLPMPFSNPSMQSYPGHQGMDYPQRTGTLVPANGAGVIFNRGYTRKAGNSGGR